MTNPLDRNITDIASTPSEVALLRERVEALEAALQSLRWTADNFAYTPLEKDAIDYSREASEMLGNMCTTIDSALKGETK